MIGEITEGFAGELGFVIINSTDKVIVEIAMATIARESRLTKYFHLKMLRILREVKFFFKFCEYNKKKEIENSQSRRDARYSKH